MIKINQTKTAQSDQILSAQDRTAIANHPLAEIMGKFEGEFWEGTLAEIQRLRDQDRKELETSLNTDDE
jgi:hypothetical protein